MALAVSSSWIRALGLIFLLISTLLNSSRCLASDFVLKGNFEVQGQDYEMRFSYSFASNQTASKQSAIYHPETVFPETGALIPASCYYHLEFPATYSVKVIKVQSQRVVFETSGSDLFRGGAAGGSPQGTQCIWDAPPWSGTIDSSLRLTDVRLQIGGKPYRFILDTYGFMTAMGMANGQIQAVSFRPVKRDGTKDGEVWLDTLPEVNGHYIRIWFLLKAL